MPYFSPTYVLVLTVRTVQDQVVYLADQFAKRTFIGVAKKEKSLCRSKMRRLTMNSPQPGG